MMRVIGIDPGTLHAGFGVVEEKNNGFHCLTTGTIHAKGDDVAMRLAVIFRGLQAQIEQYQPQAAAIETVFAGQNIKTAIVIGEARGVAMLAASLAGLPVAGFEPTLIKRAVTGSGKAVKEQVQRMIKVLLHLPEIPATDHEADALALALTYLRRHELTNRLRAKK